MSNLTVSGLPVCPALESRSSGAIGSESGGGDAHWWISITGSITRIISGSRKRMPPL